MKYFPIINSFFISVQLNDKQIIEFQNLYRKHYGKSISREEVLNEGIKLVQLVAIINNIKI